MLLVLAWAAGTAVVAARLGTLMSDWHGAAGLGVARVVALVLVGVAQSIGLFYLLGFLAKSVTYLLLPPIRPRAETPRALGEPARPVAVLYLTAGDFDATAVDSLLRLEYDGPHLFVVHDDGNDLAARERVAAFRTDAYWLDIGNPDDYARAQDDASRGIGPAATLGPTRRGAE